MWIYRFTKSHELSVISFTKNEILFGRNEIWYCCMNNNNIICTFIRVIFFISSQKMKKKIHITTRIRRYNAWICVGYFVLTLPKFERPPIWGTWPGSSAVLQSALTNQQVSNSVATIVNVIAIESSLITDFHAPVILTIMAIELFTEQ